MMPKKSSSLMDPFRRFFLDEPKYLLFILLSLFVIYFIIYPLFQLFLRSLMVDGELSVAHYSRVFTEPRNLRTIFNSLRIASGATLLSTIVGTLAAFIVVRTDIPWKPLFRFLFLLPFAIPPLFAAMGWVQLLGPTGLITRNARLLFGFSRPPWNIYSEAGIIFVLATTMYPFVFLIVSGSLQRIDASLEESARVSGCSNFRIMKDITLPLVRPAILAGALLAFVASVDNFGIPAVLGMRIRYYVLTTRIYEALSIPDMPLATAMSVLLVIIAVITISLLRYAEGARSQFSIISGKSVRPQIIRLEKNRPWVTLFLLLILFLFVLLPIFSLAITSISRFWGAPINLENVTFANFGRVLSMRGVNRAIRNSLLLAPMAATILIIVSSFISYLNIKGRMRGAALLDTIGMVPYALPGSVIGVTMILAWSSPAIGPSLYGTLWIILAAYLMRYISFGLRSTRATLQQIHDSLEEAALTSGASRLRTLYDITFPLLKPGIISGWILIFIPALRELTVSVLIWSAGSETLGVLTFMLQDSGYPQRAAALAMMILPIILVLYTVVELGFRREDYRIGDKG